MHPLCIPWLVLLLALAASQPLQAAPPANVLILLADDQRADTIHALGNPLIQTPNLDRLVRSGISLHRAYMQGANNAATCIPSRAMLLSGRPLSHIDEKLQRDTTWPEAFQTAGYTTFVTGKWHNGQASLAKCFQSARSIFSGGMANPFQTPLQHLKNGRLTAPLTHSKHACEIFADEAIEFLSHSGNTPFLCYVPFDAPHDPHIVPSDFPIHYDPTAIPLPKNYLHEHPFDNGEMNVRDETLLPRPRTATAVQAMLADYYRYISYLDSQIGRILDALSANGLAENTIVVFAADSGVARGSHGLVGKQNLYEHSLRVPLLLSGPGIPKNSESHTLCYLFDVFPTLGALCGIQAPSTSEGIDFSKTWQRPETTGRTFLDFAYKDVQRAVSDGEWKVIHYPKIHRTSLFNLKTDPDEIHDLAQQPEHQQRIQTLLHYSDAPL